MNFLVNAIVVQIIVKIIVTAPHVSMQMIVISIKMMNTVALLVWNEIKKIRFCLFENIKKGDVKNACKNQEKTVKRNQGGLGKPRNIRA